MAKEKIIHTPRRYGFRPGAEKFPKMLVVSVSHVCNSKCPHCIYTNHPEHRRAYGRSPLISEKLFRKISDEGGPYEAFIRISGAGEPFMHPKLLDLVEYAKGRGNGVGIITNGSLLNEAKIKQLVKTGLDAIEISVDTHDKKVYKRLREGLDYETVMRNISLFRKIRDDYKGKTKILVSIVNQPLENPTLKQSIKYWKRRVDNVIVRKWLRWGQLPASNVTEPYLRERVPCPFPFERMYIHISGVVRFCVYDVGLYKSYMGNANKESIKAIWRSPKFEKFRAYHLNYQYRKIKMCRECTDWAYRSWNYNYWNVLEKTNVREVKEEKVVEASSEF